MSRRCSSSKPTPKPLNGLARNPGKTRRKVIEGNTRHYKKANHASKTCRVQPVCRWARQKGAKTRKTTSKLPRRCGGSRAQTHKNEERWSGCNRFNSAGEGDVTAKAALPLSGGLVTAESWQSTMWSGWGSASWVACCMAPCGTRRSEAWATPPRSPGSRSATPVKGGTRRPEARKCSCIEKMPGSGSMSTR